MDSDHWNGSSKHSRNHLELVDESGSSKNSVSHLDVTDVSGSSKHSDAHSEDFNGSGSNKLQETHLDVTDGSVISKHSEAHLDFVDRKGNSDHFVIHPESFYGFERSNQFEIHPEIFGGSGSSNHFETRPEVVDRTDSSKHTLNPHATVNEGDLLFPSKNLKSSSSSSSSSSSVSSVEDLFQVDTKKVSKSTELITSYPKSPISAEVTQPTLEDDKNDVSNNNSKSKEFDNGTPAPTSTSQVSDINHESVEHSTPSTQSPPIQMMDRSGGYDPYRIPASVFASSKSTTPMEWSVASNESLFSIHVGNNSFSRDQFSMFGADFTKFEEFTKSDELIVSSPPPPLLVVGNDRNSVEMEKCEAARVADETNKDANSATEEDHCEEKIPPPVVSWNSSSISNRSDGSGGSATSFAFPILAGGAKSGSLKAKVEKHNLKPPASEGNKNSTSCSCFPCFPCYPCFPSCRCCSFHCCSFRCCSSRCCSFRCCCC